MKDGGMNGVLVTILAVGLEIAACPGGSHQFVLTTKARLQLRIGIGIPSTLHPLHDAFAIIVSRAGRHAASFAILPNSSRNAFTK
jgi:hypothetical protein